MLHPGSIDRTFAGGYDQLFRATYEMLRHRGFPIERIDRDAGQIVTGRRPVDLSREGRPVEKVSARLKRDEAGDTNISLSLVFVDQASDPRPSIPDDGDGERADDVFEAAVSQSFDAAAVYDAYLDAIQTRAEALSENDTP